MIWDSGFRTSGVEDREDDVERSRMVVQFQARLVGLVHSSDAECRAVLPDQRDAQRVDRPHLLCDII